MNPLEASSKPDGVGQPLSPGQMLRAARESKGVHLAMLAVAMKVPTRQLEALEKDDYSVFRGATFLRALAQTVCRHLGVDPVPVLAGLPQQTSPLESQTQALQQRMPVANASMGRGFSRGATFRRPMTILTLLVMAGAAALAWRSNNRTTVVAAPPLEQVQAVPMPLPMDSASLPAAVSAAAVSSSVAAPPVAEPPSPNTTPTVASDSPAVMPSAAASESALQLRARLDTWVEVRDGRGQVLVQRLVKAGETLRQDALAPLFVYVGRADSTELLWRGQVLDLKPHTQNNEARLKVKP